MSWKFPFKQAKSQGKSSRVMSLSNVATTFDVSRNTVMTWIKDDCPVAKAPMKKGESYELDVADVTNWRIWKAQEEALNKALRATAPSSDDDGKPRGESKEEADTRRAIAMANMAEMDEAEKAAEVVPVAAVESMIREEYAAVRAALENIGATLAGRTSSITDPVRIKQIADKLVREAILKLNGRLPGRDDEDLDDAA